MLLSTSVLEYHCVQGQQTRLSRARNAAGRSDDSGSALYMVFHFATILHSQCRKYGAMQDDSLENINRFGLGIEST